MVDRIKARRALQAAADAYSAGKPVPETLAEKTARVSRTAGEMCDVIGRISTATAIRWTIELALDGFTQDQVEEAVRLAARSMPSRDIDLEVLLKHARIVRERERALADIASAAVPRLQDPDAIAGRRSGVVMGGIMSDFTAGLIAAANIHTEYEIRHSMTDEQIEERRRELGAGTIEDQTSLERKADERRAELRAQAEALEVHHAG